MVKSGFWDSTSKPVVKDDDVVQHMVPEGSSRAGLGLELVTGSSWDN